MNRFKVRDIKKQASSLLKEQRSEFRKIVFYSYGVSVAFSMLVTLINLFLNQSMEGSQGLSGLGTVAILQTIQLFLVTAGNLLMPFWSMGLLYAAMRGVRCQQTGFSTLTQGFRRFGPVLRYLLLYGLILIALVVLCFNVVMVLAVCVPIPPALYEAVGALSNEQMMEMMGDPTAMMAFMNQVPREQLLMYYTPVMGIFAVVFSVVFLFVNYRFCMARYLLLDETKIGAFAAMHLSSRMTKGNRWNLFKLDLSFWWYSLGLVAITSINFVPDILKALQVQLPVSDTVASLMITGLGMGLELVWMVLFGPYNMLSWACAYERLGESLQQPEPVQE